jgi:hypothetical protein
MNAVHRIREWFEQLDRTGGRMQRQDVPFLMTQVRHLIEVAPTPADYRTANFYADWLLHSEIDRSPVAFEVLRDVTRVILGNLNPTGPLTTLISRVIGLPKLRAELTELFRLNRLPTVLFDYRDNWRGFVMFLVWALAGQPLQFPVEPTSRIAKVKAELPADRPYHLTVEALAIVNHHGVFNWALHVSGEKDVTVMGQVELGEDAGAFTATGSAGAT